MSIIWSQFWLSFEVKDNHETLAGSSLFPPQHLNPTGGQEISREARCIANLYPALEHLCIYLLLTLNARPMSVKPVTKLPHISGLVKFCCNVSKSFFIFTHWTQDVLLYRAYESVFWMMRLFQLLVGLYLSLNLQPTFNWNSTFSHTLCLSWPYHFSFYTYSLLVINTLHVITNSNMNSLFVSLHFLHSYPHN